MRDQTSWYKKPVKDFAGTWPEDLDGIKPSLLCQVELGLRLLERLDPSRPADGVWALLGGYPFARATGLVSSEKEEWLLTCARHRLWTMRRRRTWQQALQAYLQIPRHFRAYHLAPEGEPARRIDPTVATDRFAAYDDALESLPPFSRRVLKLAGAGSHRFIDRRRRTSVIIPGELCPDPAVAAGHDLTTPTVNNGSPLEIPLAELADTAEWMDQAEQNAQRRRGHWARRLSELHLDNRSADGLRFEASTVLRMERLLHLVGMVGAGKSTLMTLIAVWAARRGLRTTLVVGDVAEQLTLTALFRDLLGEKAAAPVLGSTTRERHVQRLHRRLAAKDLPSLLLHGDEPGFDDLSTACVVDALRGTEPVYPLRYADAPCTGLHAATSAQAVPAVSTGLPGRYRDRGNQQTPNPAHDDDLGPALGCPLWSACPRHSAARALVDALIWVANPASLVQSPVPDHLNAERLRYLELACLRSDIIIVDEADRVQMNLDSMFAPSATLVCKGPESWLDQLHTHKIEELAREGRLQLSEADVARWETALTIVSSATNRLYQMLISDPDLRSWVDIEYFSAWTLQEKLIAEWYPSLESLTAPPTGPPDGTADESDVYEDEDPVDSAVGPDQLAAPDDAAWAERRREVTKILDVFRDDPLGDHGPYDTDTDRLVVAAQDLLHTLNPQGARGRTLSVLNRLLDGSPVTTGQLPPPAPRRDQQTPSPADIPGSSAWFERTAKRFEFALQLAALHQRLDRLTFLWPQVEAALHLDATGNELSRRPPLDYAPLVPEAPMGNVLGFQYLPDEQGQSRDPDGRLSGTLRFFRCAGVGRELLLSLPEIGADQAAHRAGPHVMLMSGTSWAGTSTRAHILAPVGAVLKPTPKALDAIRSTVFTTLFVYDDEGRPISLSGQAPDLRPAVLRLMINRLGKPRRSGLRSPLEQELGLVIDEGRRRALLLVGSYREAVLAADQLDAMARWHGRVRVLAADDAELDQAVRGNGSTTDRSSRASSVRRGDVASFADDTEAELLIAPLLAVERGHNILNNQHKAAFGTVLFLARPHPRPDDLSLSIFAINDWVGRFIRDIPRPQISEEPDRYRTFSELADKTGGLNEAGLALRSVARAEWGRLLSRRYIYSRLRPAEQTSFAWDQLVAIWQVIGRLVRGGVPARVVFVDAKFAPHTASAQSPNETLQRKARQDTPATSLLASLHAILDPYFVPRPDLAAFPDPADPELVKLLYQPLYDALSRLVNSS